MSEESKMEGKEKPVRANSPGVSGGVCEGIAFNSTGIIAVPGDKYLKLLSKCNLSF